MSLVSFSGQWQSVRHCVQFSRPTFSLHTVQLQSTLLQGCSARGLCVAALDKLFQLRRSSQKVFKISVVLFSSIFGLLAEKRPLFHIDSIQKYLFTSHLQVLVVQIVSYDYKESQSSATNEWIYLKSYINSGEPKLNLHSVSVIYQVLLSVPIQL